MAYHLCGLVSSAVLLTYVFQPALGGECVDLYPVHLIGIIERSRLTLFCFVLNVLAHISLLSRRDDDRRRHDPDAFVSLYRKETQTAVV